MGDIINPDEGNSFIDLVEAKNTRIFVDKTDFITKTNAILNTDGKLLVLSRPRRFGKTVTADMLLAYYSKAYAGQNIFAGLKITDNEYKESYTRHLNKYDVIYIDMNSVRDDYIAYTEDEDLQIKGITTIVDYLQYSVIEELKENSDYAELLSRSRKVGKKNLSSALKEISRHTKEKFILIMDEWDLIYRDYRNATDLQESFIDFLRGLFKGKKGQSNFALAYLTGILPIKKYNSQSALNTFDEYNMLAPGDFACYFGFTEDEVTQILKSPECRISHQELKEWYEGYKINGIDIYNPNSVAKAVSRNECISYWSGTSSNEEVVRLINMNFNGIKEDIINLIEGREITFNCGRFQNDMVSIKSKETTPDEETAKAGKKNRRIAYVPNAEIKSALMDIVKEQEWYERMETIERSENLLKAIKALDGNRTAELIQEIHNSPSVSIYDYNSESALTFCVITGLLWSTLDNYDYHREDQAGKGRVDLVYEPAVRGSEPLILIEFKYGESAETALRQIRTQEYYKRYTKKYTRNIILVGINYDPKTKEHECLIEKLD